MIEEDPIFPGAQCASLPLHGRLQLPPIAITTPLLESPPSSAYSNPSSLTLLSDSSSGILDDRSELSTPTSPQARSFTSSSPSISTRTPSLAQLPVHSKSDVGTPDPRDHCKLAAAWNAMLSSRFISANLSKVLPLYFSSEFTDVQMHQPFKIPLPPSSGHVAPRPRGLSLGESFSCFTPSSDSPPSKNSEQDSKYIDEKSCLYSSTWHNLHLAKTVNTVKCCKNAVWQEYKTLYVAGFTPMPGRTMAADARPGIEAALRDAFEEQWSAWEKFVSLWFSDMHNPNVVAVTCMTALVYVNA